MSRRSSLLTGLVVILALAIPSLANASELTNSGGGATAVGTRLSLNSSSGSVTLTTAAVGATGCTSLDLNLRLTANSGGTVEGEGSGEGTTSGCSSTGGKTLVFSDITLTKLKSTTSGSGTINFTAKALVGGSVSCTYTGTSVPFTYTTKTNILKFVKAGGITGGNCGSTTLDAEFTLATTAGGGLVFD